MRKNLGVQPALFPMPVVIVAAYGADGNICTMNAAWAQICDMKATGFSACCFFVHKCL